MEFLWQYESCDIENLFLAEGELAEMLGMGGYEFESQYFFDKDKYILKIYADINSPAGH